MDLSLVAMSFQELMLEKKLFKVTFSHVWITVIVLPLVFFTVDEEKANIASRIAACFNTVSSML